jgi:hypothetical protein
MSYDIGLYEKRFLLRALQENLRDWTGADAIPLEKLRLVHERLKAKGYVALSQSELEHSNPARGLQVSIFTGEVSFSLPYWDEVDAPIAVARADALELAMETNLAFYDPQTGEVIK